MPEASEPANPWGVPTAPPYRFGPWQGLAAVGGFFLAQAALTAAAMVLRAMALRLADRPDTPPDAGFLAGAIIAGYLVSALGAVAWLRRRAGPRLRLGGAEGLAWCPAPWRAYPAALAAAAVSIAAAGLMLRLFPVPTDALRHSAFPALLAPGPMLIPALGLVVLAAPLVEEFLFRGALIAAFAPRLGARWAAVLSTVLFVAVHAPEKLQYPPGFLDVTVMAAGAAWLRLRYRSIRPAVALHVLYNLGVVLAAALLR
ncbi:MAG: CPBP family intramembrane glutamic endopeptidase [Acetobacteraceae bacterium]